MDYKSKSRTIINKYNEVIKNIEKVQTYYDDCKDLLKKINGIQQASKLSTSIKLKSDDLSNKITYIKRLQIDIQKNANKVDLKIAEELKKANEQNQLTEQ